MKRLILLLSVAFLSMLCVSAYADTLNLPTALTVVEEEAFCGDTSIDRVILPDGITAIESKAFANSGLKSINLPASLTRIADDALPAPGTLAVTATEGSWAYEWAVQRGYIEEEEWPASPLEDFVISKGVLTKYTGSGGDVVIPKSVTSIGRSAFKECDSLISVRIPNSVTSIGMFAFSYCFNLINVTIPNSVNSIGDSAFLYCTRLEEATIPDSVTVIENNLFSDCLALANVEIPNSVTSIGNNAFYRCCNLTNIFIPNSVKSIGTAAFESCTNLISISIPNGIKRIENETFMSCSRLADIMLPDSITNIGQSAFNFCYALSEFAIPKNVKSIESFAFHGCKGLTHITLPDGITSIEREVFRECSSLSSIVIPDSVVEIGNSAFSGCIVLSDLTIPDSVISMGDYTFSRCSSLRRIAIPTSVTSIGKNVFYNCLNLTVTVSKGSYMYQYCVDNGVKFILEGEEDDWPASPLGDFVIENGVVTKYVGTNEDVVIPNKDKNGNAVTKIGSEAFKKCQSLNRIDIPSSITTINQDAFSGCTALSVVTFHEGLTSIGRCAFANLDELKSIELPSTVKTLGFAVFNGCDNLETVVLNEGLNTLSGNNSVYGGLFENCKSLKEITIPSTVGEIESSAFKGCTNLRNVTIKNGVQKIGSYAFQNCKSLNSIEIPSSITTIKQEAFNGCNALAVVTFHEGLTSIGLRAFAGLDELRCIELPSTMRTLGFAVFNGCDNLETVVLNEGLNTLSGNNSVYGGLFENCKSLKEITIPSTVGEIESSAFKGCTNLRNVTIKNGVQKIGSEAFYNCKALAKISIPSSVTGINKSAFSGCSKITVIVDTGSYAEQYCINQGITYRTSKDYFSVGVSQGWRTTEKIYIIGSAAGGHTPYQYRFSVIQGGKTIMSTDWDDDNTVDMNLSTSGTFYVRAEAMDDWGTTAKSILVENKPLPTSGNTNTKASASSYLLAIVDSAPTPQSFSGVMYNESLPENQWLINTAIDVLHLDLSVFQTAANKQAYLFENAFKAAVNGQQMQLTHWDAMPESMKALKSAYGAEKQLYYKALADLCNQNSTVISSGKFTDSSISGLFNQFASGSITKEGLKNSLLMRGLSDKVKDYVANSFEVINEVKIVGDVCKAVGYTATTLNGIFDVRNQIELLNAMDEGALKEIANLYMLSENADVKAVGLLLNEVLKANTYEQRVKLIAGGKLANLALDTILGSFSLSSSVPWASFTYMAVDKITGSDDYAEKHNELMWASDALRIAYDGFIEDREAFRTLQSDSRFEDLVWSYTNYLQLAATVEEAYVSICELQKDIHVPGFEIPNYVIEAADNSEQKGEALRDLAVAVRQALKMWRVDNYAEVMTWLDICSAKQELIKVIGMNITV